MKINKDYIWLTISTLSMLVITGFITYNTLIIKELYNIATVSVLPLLFVMNAGVASYMTTNLLSGENK